MPFRDGTNLLDGTFAKATCCHTSNPPTSVPPYYPAWRVWKLGTAHYDTRQYENALIPLKDALNRNPKLKRAHLCLAATYAQLDRIEEAGKQVEELLANHPDVSMKQELHWGFASDEEQEHWLEGFRRAGLPE